jgi:hypothetical protein
MGIAIDVGGAAFGVDLYVADFAEGFEAGELGINIFYSYKNIAGQ